MKQSTMIEVDTQEVFNTLIDDLGIEEALWLLRCRVGLYMNRAFESKELFSNIQDEIHICVAKVSRLLRENEKKGSLIAPLLI